MILWRSFYPCNKFWINSEISLKRKHFHFINCGIPETQLAKNRLSVSSIFFFFMRVFMGLHFACIWICLFNTVVSKNCEWFSTKYQNSSSVGVVQYPTHVSTDLPVLWTMATVQYKSKTWENGAYILSRFTIQC